MTDREWPGPRWRGGPPVLAGEAMDDWVVMLRACHPWNAMLLDDVTGEFRAVLETLLHANDENNANLRATRLRHSAREHGAFRRRQGCPAQILAEEVTFAEEVIAAALLRSGAAPEAIVAAQDSLAPVVRAIERATYSGYMDWSKRPESGI